MSDFGFLCSLSRWGFRVVVAVGLVGFAGAVCTTGPAHAQQMPQRTMPEYADTTRYTDPMASLPDLPPLQAVLDYATEHAPELMQQDAVINSVEHQIDATKREWMQSVSVGAEATYGTFDEDQFVDVDPTRSFEDELNFNARARIGFNLSLLDLIGRDNQVAAQQADLRAERHQLDVIRKTVREEVIDLYFNIRQFRTLIDVRSEDFRSTQAHLDFVETSFQQGSEEISEVSRVTEFASRAESRYQEARFSYLRLYRQLENFLEIDNLESLSNPSTASQ
jgi:outer membrane protein TolC